MGITYRRGLARRVGGVEPQHVNGVVVPEREDKNHRLSKSLLHLGETTLVLEGGGVAESRLLGVTEGFGDLVTSDASDVRLRVGEDLAVLDEVALDPGAGELSDDGELLGRIDGLAGAEESCVAHAELIVAISDIQLLKERKTYAYGVEVASIRVADACVAVGGTSSTAIASLDGAQRLADGCARMRRNSLGDGVGFPDIHLGAAASVVSASRVGAVGLGSPALNIGLLMSQLATSPLTMEREVIPGH